jgi:hypothetical protein
LEIAVGLNLSAIAIPDIKVVDTMLEARAVLGTDVGEEEATAQRRVSFGRLEPIALTPESAGDDALRERLLADGTHRYWVLAFACSFTPDDEPVLESRLAIRLTLDDGDGDGGADEPMVALLDPERLITRRERTRTLSFAPKALAGPAEVSAQASQSNKLDIEDAYLVATGKGQSSAQWFFRRQPAVALEGMHDLRIVVRSWAGVSTLAELKLTAKIRRRFAGVVPYTAQLPADQRIIQMPAQGRRDR